MSTGVLHVPGGKPWAPFTDEWADAMPRAAQRVGARLLRWANQYSSRILGMTDEFIAGACGIGRRCVQKGLKQLEKEGKISRTRAFGRREITVHEEVAGRELPRPKPSTKSRPATKTTADPAAAIAARAAEAAEEERRAAEPVDPRFEGKTLLEIAAIVAADQDALDVLPHRFRRTLRAATAPHAKDAGTPTDPSGP